MMREEFIETLYEAREPTREELEQLVTEYDKMRHREVVGRARDILGACAIDRLADDVTEFMVKCDQVEHLREKPGVPSIHTVALAEDLLQGEYLELRKAMLTSEVYTQGPMGSDDEDYRQVVDDVADGIADTIFVCLWIALTYGIPMSRVWAEVAKKNLEKAGGPKHPETGKQLKPEGWKPPDIRKAVWGE